MKCISHWLLSRGSLDLTCVKNSCGIVLEQQDNPANRRSQLQHPAEENSELSAETSASLMSTYCDSLFIYEVHKRIKYLHV